MTTPKQRRLRKPEQPDNETPFPPVIDERFDDMDTAEIEFTRWRFPERSE